MTGKVLADFGSDQEAPEPGSHSYQGEEATQIWDKRYRLPVNLSLTDYLDKISMLNIFAYTIVNRKNIY